MTTQDEILAAAQALGTDLDEIQQWMATTQANVQANNALLLNIQRATSSLAGITDDLRQRVVALENPPVVATPPVFQVTMPPAPAGWRTVIAEDFDTPCVEGAFSTIYGPRRIAFYPRPYPDTSGRGRYSGDYISVQGSICTQRLFTTNSGVPQVSALVPRATDSGRWGDSATGLRLVERVRFPVQAGYKAAHMFWPASDDSHLDGELDFPEVEFGSAIQAFFHQIGGLGQQSDHVPTGTDMGAWHVFESEWKAGLYWTVKMDGAIIRSWTGPGVPKHAMHCVLQNETSLRRATSSGPYMPIDPKLQVAVDTDWIQVCVPI